MAPTLLTKTNAPGSYAHAGAALTLANADVANGNDFVANGHDLIIAHNSGASPYTVTVTSQPDPFGRTKHITAESLAAGEIRIFGPFALVGWAGSNGRILVSASNSAVKLGVVKLPG